MNHYFYLYGIHAVHAALQKNPKGLAEIMVQHDRKDQRLREILTLAKEWSVPIKSLNRAELDSLVDHAVHQGVIARAQEKNYTENDLEDLLDNLQEPPFLLILDGVQDPHNLGACLRSANAAGVQAVIVPKDNAVGLTPVVRKVASGAAELTPCVQVTNLARTLRMLKERGIWLYGTSDDAKLSIYQASLTGPLGLILGAEGSGLRRMTREICDESLRIPMYGSVSSLNVSVATGVCLFEALRQRQKL